MCNYTNTSHFSFVLYVKEKSQTAKQKSNVSGKRGDKRNFKVSTKAKYDSFSMRAGLVSFSPAAGGNNFFGMTLM